MSASEGDGDEEQSLPAASDISKLSSQFASRKNGLQNDHHPGMEMEEDVAKETCGLSEKRDVHFGRKRQVPEVTNPAWYMFCFAGPSKGIQLIPFSSTCNSQK